jgi:hypothetical protein
MMPLESTVSLVICIDQLVREFDGGGLEFAGGGVETVLVCK